jgi:hypothetical protein
MLGNEADEADTEEKDTELLGSNTVTFAHFSVKEYITSDRIRSEGGPISRFCFSEYAAHAFIEQTCLAYLSLFDARDPWLDSWFVQSQIDFPLIGYAAQHWPRHARVAEYFASYSAKTTSPALGLFDSKSHAYFNWLQFWDPDKGGQFLRNSDGDFINPDYITPPPLYYAALLRLPVLAQELLKLKDVDVNAIGGSFGNALMVAASHKFEPTLQIPIEDQVVGDEQNPASELKLVIAAKDQSEAVARVLLTNGAAIDAKSQKGRTALHAAAKSGNEAVLQLLPDHKPNIEATGDDKETPLHIAAKKGNIWIVRLLLNNEANVHTKQERGLTALHEAAIIGHSTITSLLLDHGQGLTKETPKRELHHCMPLPQELHC